MSVDLYVEINLKSKRLSVFDWMLFLELYPLLAEEFCYLMLGDTKVIIWRVCSMIQIIATMVCGQWSKERKRAKVKEFSST